jgi:hypothetical protein
MLPRLGSQFQPPKPPWAQDQEQQGNQFGLPELPFAPKPQQQQAAPADPNLTPEEESSLLGNVLGGVQWLGETLDKPGAALRGTLSGMMGGEWGGGLLNLVPFSDAMGLTDPQKRVYGRDLLETAGLAEKNKPGLNLSDPADVAGDVAGFATEVLLDPLTMVTGPLGSLTKAGQAITKGAKVAEKGADLATAESRFMTQAAGKAVEGSTLATTPAAMAQQIREGQRGLLGLKLPWQSEAEVTFGAGSEMAAKALEAAAYGKYSPVRPIRSLFSQSAGGAFEGALQRANDIAFGERQQLHDAVLDIAPVLRETHDGLDDTFRSIQNHFQTLGDTNAFDEFSRAALEVKGGVPQGDDLLGLLREHAGLTPDADLGAVVGDTNALADQMHEFFGTLKRTEDTFYDRYRALGGRGDLMKDEFTDHFGRRANAAVQRLGATPEGGKSGSKFAFWMRRSNELRDLPGGSETINGMVRDLGLWGRKPLEDAGTAVSDVGAEPWRTVRDKFKPHGPQDTNNQIKQVTGATTPAQLLKHYQQKYPELQGVRLGGLADSGTSGRLSNEGTTRVVMDQGKLAPSETWIHLTSDADLTTARHEIEHLLDVIHGSNLAGKQEFGRFRHEQFGSDYLHRQFVKQAIAEGKPVPPAVLADYPDLQGKVSSAPTRTGGLARMNKAEHEAYLTAQLQEMGVAIPEKAKLADLQEAYLWNKHLKPSIDKWLVENGGEAAAPEAIEQYQKFLGDFTHADKRQTLNITKTRSGTDKFVSELLPNRTRRLVRYLKGMPDDVYSKGMFDKSVVQDWFGYMDSLLGKMATLRTAHTFLGQPGVVRMAGDAARGANDIQLVKAWKDAGFDKRGLQAFVGSQPDLLSRLEDTPIDDFVKNLYLQEGAEKTLKAFGEVVQPKTENALIKGFDKLTSLYKGALTVPWPSFHVRNLGSGFWQSWSEGKVGFSDLMAGYLKAGKHAAAKYGKATGEGGLEYIDEIVNNGILSGHGQLVDILGEEAAERAGKVPDAFLGGLLGAVKNKAPGQAGEHLYSYVEFLNRAGYYEALRKGGYTPAQAMHLVKRSQFDYGALSSFEKSVMRRVVPFYSFSRLNLPYQFAKLAERPGGRTAQTIRAYTDAMESEPGSYTPEFLREGMAVRVEGDNANATFLKQTGLPVEDLNKFAFSGGAPDLARTGEKFAAMLHPAMAWLPETWAGKQFYTGRSLKDLNSPTGDATGTPMPFVDRLIHYSPVSRAVGELQGAVDDRKTALWKAANALSGLKTGSYDVDKWRLVDYQNALKEQIEESPLVREGQYYYVPEKYKSATNAPAVQKQIRRTRGLAKAVKNLKSKRDKET